MLILNAGQRPLCSALHLSVEVLLISNFQYSSRIYSARRQAITRDDDDDDDDLDVSCMGYIPRPGYISWDG